MISNFYIIHLGEYYIDPNGGHWRDSFPVQCQFETGTTKILPQMKQVESVGLSHITSRRGIFWYATAAFRSIEGVRTNEEY